eukprot:TRINITY_DN5593_c1_g1_i1.p1 TRINITY_DN5593_c1_g1~~TRINITY_DN5593_c1_g1_i1.p1  ORF type:complete len:344 (+),score=134.74 TRINITY_DN5593_c1_g1_i1:21-1052(+)
MSFIRVCIRQLIEGHVPSSEQITECMQEIMSGAATPAQVSAYLIALRFSKLSPELLHASALGMASFSLPLATTANVIDIVGTGGDLLDTFNVSTAAAFVVAAAGGKVAKHGNRSSSGRCGSADFIEALGAALDLSAQPAAEVLDKCGFCFLFAQKFHPAMKSVAAVRREIGIRTIFNVLGPLTNPAKPTYMLVGVGSADLLHLFARVFQLQGLRRAMIVHSLDGLDEISPAAPTRYCLVEAGNPDIIEGVLRPQDFGLPSHSLESVAGSVPPDNVATFWRVLRGEQSPVADFLLLNAGAALYVAGLSSDLRSGVELARSTISSGKVAQLVDSYIQLSNEAASS